MPVLLISLDECFDHRLVPTLRNLDCDVLTVRVARSEQLSDESQLLLAAAQGRLLLSHNQVDFRRLHNRLRREGRKHADIVLIPQTVPLALLQVRTTLILEWLATFPGRESMLFTWADLQQRLIHGYRISGSRCSEDDVRRAVGWRTDGD